MPDAMQALETFIFEKMAQTRLPGLSLALLEGSAVVYRQAFGLRDVERGLPATPATLYAVASLTKSVTCLAVLQLQERGALQVEDPVDVYLPLRLRPFGERIRIHHLMSHSSGVPCLGYADAVISHALGIGECWLPASGWRGMLTFLEGADQWVHA